MSVSQVSETALMVTVDRAATESNGPSVTRENGIRLVGRCPCCGGDPEGNLKASGRKEGLTMKKTLFLAEAL